MSSEAAPTAATVVSPEPTTPSLRCLNCNAKLTGPYCDRCGQRDDRRVHSLGHFLHQAFEGLTHADSRLWRTLVPLITRPGLLTREFFEGRRERYLPPFRLYLVVSLLFFVVVAALPGAKSVVRIAEEVGGETPADLDRRRAQLEARIAKLRTEEAQTIDADLRTELASMRERLTTIRDRSAESGDGARAGADEPADPGVVVVGGDSACREMAFPGNAPSNFLGERFLEGCLKAVRDQGSLGRAFLHNVPRALFVFLPLIALTMKLMYWRPKRYYVEHLLFLVHNHAFVFLVLLGYFVTMALVATRWVTVPLTVGLCVWLPIYFYRGMRVVYGQRRALTLPKYLLLANIYLGSAVAMLVITMLYSVATL